MSLIIHPDAGNFSGFKDGLRLSIVDRPDKNKNFLSSFGFGGKEIFIFVRGYLRVTCLQAICKASS
jgi:hypothetical protein